MEEKKLQSVHKWCLLLLDGTFEVQLIFGCLNWKSNGPTLKVKSPVFLMCKVRIVSNLFGTWFGMYPLLKKWNRDKCQFVIVFVGLQWTVLSWRGIVTTCMSAVIRSCWTGLNTMLTRLQPTAPIFRAQGYWGPRLAGPNFFFAWWVNAPNPQWDRETKGEGESRAP